MTDHTKYHQLQSAMRCMIHAGQLQSDAFQDAWRQCETIKNKHGGLPPIPDDYTAAEMELAETANMEGTR